MGYSYVSDSTMHDVSRLLKFAGISALITGLVLVAGFSLDVFLGMATSHPIMVILISAGGLVALFSMVTSMLAGILVTRIMFRDNCPNAYYIMARMGGFFGRFFRISLIVFIFSAAIVGTVLTFMMGEVFVGVVAVFILWLFVAPAMESISS